MQGTVSGAARKTIEVSNVKIAIGLPLSWDYVPFDYMASILPQFFREGMVFVRSVRGRIDEMRNQIASTAMANGCTHVIFTDADHRFHPRTFETLVKHDLPIVGALCYMRYPPYEPVMFKGEPGKYEIIEKWDDDLVEVDATGAGCLCVKAEVFQKMKYPWFEFTPNPRPGFPVVGEDVSFCHKAKQLGYRIYVDTTIVATHLATLEVDGKVYESFKQAPWEEV